MLFLCTLCVAAQQHRLADSLQKKIDHIEQNAQAAHPDPVPTVLTEDEINDYFAAGRVKLPQGVKKVTFRGQSGVVTALAVIDFDEIKQGQHTSNPLLSIFNGTHNVSIEADAVGIAGKGKFPVIVIGRDLALFLAWIDFPGKGNLRIPPRKFPVI